MTTKKHAALLLMTLVALTGLLNAQTSTTFKAQVPFGFVTNGKTMPSGECKVDVVVRNGQTLLSISSGKQHIFAFPTPDESPKASKKTALVFHRYGDRYFLAGLKHDGGIGYELPASRPERELLARNVPWQVFTLLASAK